MRQAEALGWIVQNPSRTMLRALHLAAIVLGIGLVMSANAARAEDDEDDATFEEKIIKQIMTGIGGTNMENTGIEYRERSPLVIPPSLDLPPPDQADASARNPAWPREQTRRKTAVQAKPQLYATPEDPGTSSRMSPEELRRGTNRNAGRVTDPSKSG